MPVWSIVIALSLLIAVKLAMLGGDEYLRETELADFQRSAKSPTS